VVSRLDAVGLQHRLADRADGVVQSVNMVLAVAGCVALGMESSIMIAYREEALSMPTVGSNVCSPSVPIG
jgi:hypothetical protein